MNASTLDTGVKQVKNVSSYTIGPGSLDRLPARLAVRRTAAMQAGRSTRVLFVIDQFFQHNGTLVSRLPIHEADHCLFVSTEHEPKTDGIDAMVAEVKSLGMESPATIVGIGGGCTLDTAKAIANLLTNPGRAEDYQGWDLVTVPAIEKIGIPTLSGTGAEATRTCVMTNSRSGLKLGMNSDYTVYDELILDPDLTATVPRNQYFYSGMDAYIHCMESSAGSYRNAIGDAYSRETIRLCRSVFHNEDMMCDEARQQLMVASYLGGCAIATSYVGVVHPFSAGLSVVLGVHHCIGNCIAMRAMHEFYPEGCDEFWTMVDRQGISIPEGIARDLADDQYRALIDATVIHEKPLTNALGEQFREVLTDEKVVDLFKQM